MWSPTHIQVTIQRAKGLLTKGKNGTNNCFVTIALGKEKYQTSVKEKAEADVSWHEECELKIPDQGNRAELVLTCLHRNNLAIDEFLGQATLPLNEMDFHDRPRSKWYKLESKPGKDKKNKERGELEVRITFNVKSGSLTDLSKKEKHKSSIGQLASSVGGSLLSIGTIEKRKGIKKFAKSLGSKMHLNGNKKKNKEGGDDGSSFSGSFNSIGTPNSSVSGGGGNRRYGQRAGEADPGVISEDEDEFVFDNLSHKSSASSLTGRAPLGTSLGTSNFIPHQPSPLLSNGKPLGKQQLDNQIDDDNTTDIFEVEQRTNTLVGAHTLPPPPTKPPRTPQLGIEYENNNVREKSSTIKLDEWESKLYGKHLDISGSESLKRRSWELNPVPLPPTSNDGNKNSTPELDKIKIDPTQETIEDNVEEHETVGTPPNATPRNNFLPAEEDKNENDFDTLNATFAQFEMKNSSKIFNSDAEEKKRFSQALINAEGQQKDSNRPQAKPRNKETNGGVVDYYKNDPLTLTEHDDRKQLNQEDEERMRAEEDARLEEELRLNERKLCEEEAALQAEMKTKPKQENENENEKQIKREMKRREEDERILNFARQRSLTVEGEKNVSNASQYASTTPEESPKQRIGDNREKRFGKFKYFNRKDKNEGAESPTKSNERIIIGHEKSASHAERRSEITAALTKKYEGKSREELMLIANGMENEALVQRQRVKELEDYLDNLLLRVMETQPKLLQNPYSRTTSAKSG